jgi:SAM-dependent methyltransferase
MNQNAQCEKFYEDSYKSAGFAAQRRYPNEELMRFLGREYSKFPAAQKKSMRILEVGSGSGGNLWAIAHEGFDTYGIELSAEGVSLCHNMMDLWGKKATLAVGDMCNLPYEDNFFDAIVDVFSAYCLDEKMFAKYLEGVGRVLKPGGKYFSYTPSKNSDAFKNYAPATLLDNSTLSGIHRETSPFYGNKYPFRFIAPDEHAAAMAAIGSARMKTAYNETVGRTYRHGTEYFEFSVLVARKE